MKSFFPVGEENKLKSFAFELDGSLCVWSCSEDTKHLNFASLHVVSLIKFVWWSWFDISVHLCVLSMIDKIVKVLGVVMMYSMWFIVICSYSKDWICLPSLVVIHICSVSTFPPSSRCSVLVPKSNAYWMDTIWISNKESFTGSWSRCCRLMGVVVSNT